MTKYPENLHCWHYVCFCHLQCRSTDVILYKFNYYLPHCWRVKVVSMMAKCELEAKFCFWIFNLIDRKSELNRPTTCRLNNNCHRLTRKIIFRYNPDNPFNWWDKTVSVDIVDVRHNGIPRRRRAIINNFCAWWWSVSTFRHHKQF